MKWTVIGAILATLVVAAFFVISEAQSPASISINPEAEALCLEGTADVEAFKLRDGIEKLEQALELDPNLAEAAIALAMAQGRLGHDPVYQTLLTRADSLAGLIDDDSRRMLAQLRLSSGEKSGYRTMRDSLLTYLKTHQPDNIYVLEATAGNALYEDDQVTAERIYKRILEINPNYAASYNALGYMELHRGNFEQAIAYMQKYAFLAPDLANPHDSLGEVFLVMGRYEDAEREFIQSITMQPDFYHSLINLGKVYLARGQIRKGVGILEKVRTQLAGSSLEMWLDVELLRTYLKSGLEEPLAEMTTTFIDRHAETRTAVFFRAMRLAYQGRLADSQAVMDSSLVQWRKSPAYANQKKQQLYVDSTAKRYEALIADLADSPATRVRHWNGLLAMVEQQLQLPDQDYDRWRLARALLDNGNPDLALVQADLMLELNPRLTNFLIVNVESHLALQDPEKARAGLEQLKWTLSQADSDFPALLLIPELETKVEDLEQRSL